MYPAGVGGITVRYVTLGSGVAIRVLESGPADGPIVLLVHGWGGCAYSFAETIPALAHAGHRVIAMDLPGHGLSDKPADEQHYTTRALLDAVLGVLSEARVRRFTYVGHSMGGLLGLKLAAGGKAGLERLVLISSAGLTRIAVLGPIKLLSPRPLDRVMPALLSRRLIAGILNAAFGTKERPTQRDIDEYWALTQWDEYAWACRACVHRVDFTRVAATKLRSLRIPVLVITGGRDRVVGMGGKRARLIPTARLVHLPEGGHLVMQECAGRTNAEILAFLANGRGV
jgi:pimeloyl-ACP methyl ester carboxylesterase